MGNTGMKRSTASVAQRRFPPLSGWESARRLSVRRCTNATLPLVGLALCVLASGCRSGVTSLSAPKWWAFGDAKSANAKNFSSAPAFGGSASTTSAEGTIQKPSEVATAYPTTSTPNGYAMAGSAPAAAAAAAIPAATAEPSAVTYGVTPTRSQSMPAVTSQVASTTLDPSVPQMGRYESMPAPPAPAPAAPPPAASGFAAGYPAPAAPLGPAPADPAATATAGMAPAPSAFPATAGYEPVRERLAENRSIDALGPAAAVAAANPGLAPVEQSPLADPASNSGYRNVSGSRFAGGGTPALPAAMTAAAPLVPPPAAIPPAAATPPAATPPAAWTPPAAASGGPAATPAVPPPRRPDPVYRPAGTSSYRPSEQILVDDPPASPSAVRTAGYEVPFPAAPRDPQPLDQ